MLHKSIKVQNINNLYTTYRAVKANDRFAMAYRSEDESPVFHLVCGTLGMGGDIHETYDTLAELESEMRDFADLRKWQVYNA